MHTTHQFIRIMAKFSGRTAPLRKTGHLFSDITWNFCIPPIYLYCRSFTMSLVCCLIRLLVTHWIQSDFFHAHIYCTAIQNVMECPIDNLLACIVRTTANCDSFLCCHACLCSSTRDVRLLAAFVFHLQIARRLVEIDCHTILHCSTMFVHIQWNEEEMRESIFLIQQYLYINISNAYVY